MHLEHLLCFLLPAFMILFLVESAQFSFQERFCWEGTEIYLELSPKAFPDLHCAPGIFANSFLHTVTLLDILYCLSSSILCLFICISSVDHQHWHTEDTCKSLQNDEWIDGCILSS